MSLAYLIRAHQRPEQLVRLVERLSTPDASFHVHVCARASDEVYAAMRNGLAGRDDVHWVERMPVYYSGFSAVRALLACLRSSSAGGTAPDHAVLLSGQDYPLRPAREIKAILARLAGESVLEHHSLPWARWAEEDGGLDRIRYWHFERVGHRTRILRLPFLRRSFPQGLVPFGGSAWGVLSAEAVRILLTFPDENPGAFRFFRHVKNADELFVQTVLLNSVARGRVVNDVVHHIEWPGGSHPATFRSADLPRLAVCGKLFARKFDVEVDAEILDLVDRELLSVEGEPAVQG